MREIHGMQGMQNFLVLFSKNIVTSRGYKEWSSSSSNVWLFLVRDLVLGWRAVAVEAQDAAGGVGGHAQVALALAQLRK